MHQAPRLQLRTNTTMRKGTPSGTHSNTFQTLTHQLLWRPSSLSPVLCGLHDAVASGSRRCHARCWHNISRPESQSACQTSQRPPTAVFRGDSASPPLWGGGRIESFDDRKQTLLRSTKPTPRTWSDSVAPVHCRHPFVGRGPGFSGPRFCHV